MPDERTRGTRTSDLGHLQAAHVHLDRAIQLSGIVHDNYVGLFASGELGRCSLRQQSIAQARAAWRVGERIGREYRGIGDAYTPLRHGQAEMNLLQVERASEAERAEWLRKANRACKSAFTRVKRFHPGAPEAMLPKGHYEWLRGKPKGARKWWEKGLVEAERMRLKYDIGMIHLEMGQRLGEPGHLEKAESIFTEIGAELDLAKARELLGR